MSEHSAGTSHDAWTELGHGGYDRYWTIFDSQFGFRAGMSSEAWPGIREPVPSVTFDLGVIVDGPRWAAAFDAINAEALRAFVWSLPDTDLIVLDWQHPAYRFNPARQALAQRADWRVPVYPDGDYFAFLTEDSRRAPLVIPGSRRSA